MKENSVTWHTGLCPTLQVHPTSLPPLPWAFQFLKTLLPRSFCRFCSLKASSLPSTPNFPTISGTASLKVPSLTPRSVRAPLAILTIVNYKLALSIGTFHLPLQGLNQVLLRLLAFNTPLERVQGGEEIWGTLRSGKNGQNGSSDSEVFSGDDFMSPILIHPHIQKNTKIPHGDICFSWLVVTLTRNLLQKSTCLIAGTPPSLKSHTDLTPYLSGAISQSYLKFCLLCNSPQFSSVAQSCLTLCNSMDCSTPGLPVYHQLPEFTQTHVH